MPKESPNLKLNYATAFAIGVVFGWIQGWFWAIYPVNNRITNWLIDTFAEQVQSEYFYLLSAVHDFVVLFAFALVLAILMRRMFGYQQWGLVLAVVLGWHIALFWNTQWENMHLVMQSWRFWINLLTTLSVIPIAYAMVGRVRRAPTQR